MSNIVSGNTLAEVAALIGDAARANILSALMGGQALTAGELARHAGVTAQTTSGHLAKLADFGLISVEKQGRHRYYRLRSPEIARALQELMALAASGPKRHHPLGPRDQALRLARTCYDHLAGRVALALTDSFHANGLILLGDGAAQVTDAGRAFFSDFGIGLGSRADTRRPLCRTCLDWSERRPHLAGHLGAALLDRLIALGWFVPIPESRALKITSAGENGLISTLGLPPKWRDR